MSERGARSGPRWVRAGWSGPVPGELSVGASPARPARCARGRGWPPGEAVGLDGLGLGVLQRAGAAVAGPACRSVRAGLSCQVPPPPPPPFVRRRVGRGSRPPPGASSCRLWGRSVVRIAGRPAAGLAGPNQVSLVAAQGLGGPRCPETAVEELASCSVGSS